MAPKIYDGVEKNVIWKGFQDIYFSDLEKDDWIAESDVRVNELKDSANKLRDSLYLAAMEIDDKAERQKRFHEIPTIDQIIEKGLQHFEDELAVEEESDHMKEVPRIIRKRLNKSGRVRPGTNKIDITKDELTSDEGEDDNEQYQKPKRKRRTLDTKKTKKHRENDSSEDSTNDIEGTLNKDIENTSDSDSDEVFNDLIDDDDLIEEDLAALENSNEQTTRPQLQIGQRVKVNPASALYAGENWTGLADQTSKGWTLNTKIHGVIRREVEEEGRRGKTIWKVQWFGPNVLPHLYQIDNPSRIYACFSHEYDRSMEKKYKPIL